MREYKSLLTGEVCNCDFREKGILQHKKGQDFPSVFRRYRVVMSKCKTLARHQNIYSCVWSWFCTPCLGLAVQRADLVAVRPRLQVQDRLRSSLLQRFCFNNENLLGYENIGWPVLKNPIHAYLTVEVSPKYTVRILYEEPRFHLCGEENRLNETEQENAQPL